MPEKCPEGFQGMDMAGNPSLRGDIFLAYAELENSVRRKNVRKDFRARM